VVVAHVDPAAPSTVFQNEWYHLFVAIYRTNLQISVLSSDINNPPQWEYIAQLSTRKGAETWRLTKGNTRNSSHPGRRVRKGQAGTEELRQGMIHYRTLFEELVGEPGMVNAQVASYNPVKVQKAFLNVETQKTVMHTFLESWGNVVG
jgi:hypothetical protein